MSPYLQGIELLDENLLPDFVSVSSFSRGIEQWKAE